jgi:hypothetical protein
VDTGSGGRRNFLTEPESQLPSAWRAGRSRSWRSQWLHKLIPRAAPWALRARWASSVSGGSRAGASGTGVRLACQAKVRYCRAPTIGGAIVRNERPAIRTLDLGRELRHCRWLGADQRAPGHPVGRAVGSGTQSGDKAQDGGHSRRRRYGASTNPTTTLDPHRVTAISLCRCTSRGRRRARAPW